MIRDPNFIKSSSYIFHARETYYHACTVSNFHPCFEIVQLLALRESDRPYTCETRGEALVFLSKEKESELREEGEKGKKDQERKSRGLKKGRGKNGR